MIQDGLWFISIIIVVAALLTIIARIIKQPPIIAYLFSGVLVGPLFFDLVGTSYSSMIQTFAHIGVVFLLFIVGLSLDLRVLKEVGKVSTFAGLIEIILTSSIAFLIAIGLGFSNITALYLGIALAFSSTVVVVKTLADKKEIDSLHGRIALGILIVEDFVAALALMAIPLLNQSSNFYLIIKELGLVISLIILIFLFTSFLLNRLLNYLAKSQETLFLFGIAWVLIISVIFNSFGFSLEIGALIAGMSLASSRYNLEIGSKIKPLRDFFMVLFFVFFGSQLTEMISADLVKKAIAFSAFITIGKPIIVMSVLRLFGYKRRTNFLAGASLAQVSEFSLILGMMGYTLGYLTKELLSLIVLIAIITIALSSYSIYHSTSIFNRLSKILGTFEKEEKIKNKITNYDVVVFGYHRVGYKILERLKKMKLSFVIVDYNPKTILNLDKQGIKNIFGDANNKEFLEEIKLYNAKLIISTITEHQSNLIIREVLDENKSKSIFIVTTEQPRNAVDLYKKGVDYVLIPHHLGGEHAAEMIEKFGLGKLKYKEAGKKHLKELEKGKNKSKYN
ncbi:cation:proton antiporter [Candidatus Woesearchaeota archaeon]|nr:cation:proton antiporter [Candidatus Woesearchaeota archaeon]